MKSRKRLLIDKKFQLGTTFSIIQVVYVLFALIMVVIVINGIINNRKLAEAVLNHKHVITSQYNTFSSLLVLSRERSCTIGDIVEVSDRVAGETDKSMMMISSNIKSMESIIINNYIIIFSIFGLVIIQGIVLFVIIIRKTHRIIGPAKLMVEQMNEIIEGKIPELRPLREKDELQELYDTFGNLVDYLRKRQG